MGAYPQGNRRRYMRSLWKRADVDWDFLMWGRSAWYRITPRPDRYKSYQRERKFKRLIIRELLDDQRSRYMRTIEEMLGEE